METGGVQLGHMTLFLPKNPEIFFSGNYHDIVNFRHFVNFYRAMHFSAYARSWDRMSSVRLSVRLSVCLSFCDVGGL